MSNEPSKSDWKHFKVIRESALQRLCERILSEVCEIATDDSRTFHERYLAAFKSINDGDKNVAQGFNDLSRSRMIMQLAFMKSQGLLDEAEIAKFTSEVQERLKLLMNF